MTATTATFRKIRSRVATASTGCTNGKGRAPYYDSVGHAIGAVDSRLLDFNLRIDPNDWACKSNCVDFSDGNVSITCEVCDGCGSHECDINLSFYRMPSGRYELTVYVC